MCRHSKYDEDRFLSYHTLDSKVSFQSILLDPSAIRFVKLGKESKLLVVLNDNELTTITLRPLFLLSFVKVEFYCEASCHMF
jgi:hypothetical protein